MCTGTSWLQPYKQLPPRQPAACEEEEEDGKVPGSAWSQPSSSSRGELQTSRTHTHTHRALLWYLTPGCGDWGAFTGHGPRGSQTPAVGAGRAQGIHDLVLTKLC